MTGKNRTDAFKAFYTKRNALVQYKLKLLTWFFVAVTFLLTSKIAFGRGLFVSVRQHACMILTLGFTFALGVLLPVFMNSFEESREKAGKCSIY